MIGVLRYQSLFFPAAVLFLLVAVAIPDLNARKQPIQGKPALPGRDCQVPALKNWAPQEKWVWEQVCQGKIADFNKTKGYGGKLDPKKDKEWPSNRILRPAFLETILLHEHYRGALTRHGVCIIGAWFKQPLDLSNATLLHQLWLECSRFESHLDLSRAKTLCLLSLEGSVFNGTVNLAFGEFIKETNMVAASFASKLDMVGMQAGHLLMHGGAEFSEVDLRYAKIGGQVAMNGSKFRAKLNMHGMQVESSLHMRQGAEFSEVDLRYAKIGGQVAMDGSKFSGKLDMNGMQVESSLHMSLGAEFSEVVLRGAKVGSQVSMDGSKFSGKLNMNGMQVESSLHMSQGAEFSEVDLRNAKIGGQVAMNGSKFRAKLDMNSMQAGHLLMHGGTEFSEVDFVGARIGGKVEMNGSKFSGKLNMNSMQAGHLLMHGGAEFSEVDLVGARIGGQVAMDGSKFSGKLDMNSMQVENSLIMYGGAEFTKPVTLTFAKIGGNLALSGSTFASVDLTGTQVRGQFALGPPTAKWLKEAKLTLRNTEVGALQDLPNAWPDSIELDGFTYALLGGHTPDKSQDMAARAISKFRQWLEKQERYSPQPYEQLAKALRKQGYPDKANDVLYAGKNRELTETSGLLNRLGLVLLKIFIGYGYRIHYAIYWFLGFVVLGVLVLRISGQGPAHRMPYGIAYSLDILLPIVRLRQSHYDIDLAGWARYYFYLHILLGYILGSYLVAGISGLTK